MMLKQVVQQRQMREGDSRNNCQVGGLHQIIKIIGHGIIHILCLCLCGIHLLVCMVIPQLLILILGMDLYVMEVIKLFCLPMIKSQNIYFSYACSCEWIYMADILISPLV
jgi:hypothetical protein